MIERLLWVVICCLLVPQLSYASSCAPLSPEVAYEQAAVIFTGTAVKVDYLEAPKVKEPCGNKLTTFQIEKLWKGEKQAQIEVFSVDGCLFLGGYFHEGEKYLVYAHDQQSDAKWKGREPAPQYDTSVCVRTKSYGRSDIESDLKVLQGYAAD